MAIRDPYEVLGVSRSAGADEIKSAYRRLARKYHPDVNQNDAAAEEKFKEVGAAYAVLSDPERKSRFDQFGTTDDQASDPFAGANGGIGDLFDMFFGAAGGSQGGRRRGGRDGADITIELELTLLDVLTGISRELEIDKLVECGSCAGRGTEGGKPPETCSTCRGQGAVSAVRNTFIGQVRTQTTCPTCGGEGILIKSPCTSCRGKGTKREKSRVTANIPPGVERGSSLHMPGHGNDGTNGGVSGDLYVVLNVRDDSRFQRRGTDVHTEITLTFAQAALGDQLTLDGIDGEVSVDVAAGTQPGARATVKGHGLPPLHGGRRGDFFVHFNVKIPEKLGETEAKLIRELAELRGEPIPKGEAKGGILGGIFGKKK